MTQKQRLQSLDVLRGLLIAAMILVNDPGSWSHLYAPLSHAEWHGFTPTDLIFPGFLFIVGISISLAFAPVKAQTDQHLRLLPKMLRRVAILFGLGLLLNAFPEFQLSTWRIPGVLQRIAVVFLICAWIYLRTNSKQQLNLLIFILVGYWALLTFVPVPGVGEANLQPKTNLAAWLDVTIFGKHLWQHSISGDPEGLLSTLPAIGTGILGILAGILYQQHRDNPIRWVRQLFVFGSAMVLLGVMWNFSFPINKNLWTSSFVLFTGGLSFLLLGICVYLIDLKGLQAWAIPFRHFGMNPIVLYFLSGIVASSLYAIPGPGASGSLHNWLFENLFHSWLPSKLASLSFALIFVACFWVLAYVLYRKKIFIKV